MWTDSDIYPFPRLRCSCVAERAEQSRGAGRTPKGTVRLAGTTALLCADPTAVSRPATTQHAIPPRHPGRPGRRRAAPPRPCPWQRRWRPAGHVAACLRLPTARVHAELRGLQRQGEWVSHVKLLFCTLFETFNRWIDKTAKSIKGLNWWQLPKL